MKNISILLLIIFLFFTGCRYEAPLTQEHNIPIDASVLGLWEIGPEDEDGSGKREQMLILRYSETGYLIHYPIGEHDMYFRGYPVEIDGVSCVQLQFIGSGEGPPDKDEKELFNVASYRLTKGELVVRILNTRLIDDDLKNSSELRKAFIRHKDNKELFRDPKTFKRIK